MQYWATPCSSSDCHYFRGVCSLSYWTANKVVHCFLDATEVSICYTFTRAVVKMLTTLWWDNFGPKSGFHTCLAHLTNEWVGPARCPGQQRSCTPLRHTASACFGAVCLNSQLVKLHTGSTMSSKAGEARCPPRCPPPIQCAHPG